MSATTTLRKNDWVSFKPEFRDPGDEEIGFRCIDDEEKGRVTIMACLGWPVNPTQVVSVDQLEKDDRPE